MVLVDTNVLIDVLQDDPEWAVWSVRQLEAQSQVNQLTINPIIYAELSLSYATFEEVEEAVADLGLVVLEVPRPALYLAGKAFLRYRRAGGVKSNVLPDFFIGAHAAVANATLLTRDARRYASHFPGVSLITPQSAGA